MKPDANIPHELHAFMKQLTDEMSAEYDRIQKRATEDPGTAGDEGEENWAAILRGWLPRTYEVVTKGRILGYDGRASPQIDVLVLKDSYPERLLKKKVYLSAGVAAAFECKTTLRACHIGQAMLASTEIKNLYPKRTGSPYREIHSDIVYGLLAHSHSWTASQSTPVENIDRILRESDRRYVTHPSYGLDILCVANLAAWSSTKIPLAGPFPSTDPKNELAALFGKDGSAISVYSLQGKASLEEKKVTPIGMLISYLSMRLAWENSSLRSLAEYYRAVDIAGYGGGEYRTWPASIYSKEVYQIMRSGRYGSNTLQWDEWDNIYF